MVSEVLAGYVQIFRPCAGKPQLTAFFPPPSGGTTFPVESSSDMSDAQRFILAGLLLKNEARSYGSDGVWRTRNPSYVRTSYVATY